MMGQYVFVNGRGGSWGDNKNGIQKSVSVDCAHQCTSVSVPTIENEEELFICVFFSFSFLRSMKNHVTQIVIYHIKAFSVLIRSAF